MLNRQLYFEALTESLLAMSIEDMNEHGCLLMLKEKLMNLAEDQHRNDIKTLAMF